MFRSLAVIALLALQAGNAIAAAVALPAPFRCGSENPPAEIVAQAKLFHAQPGRVAAVAAADTINVNAYFHVVTTSASEGSITQGQLDNQVRL